MQVRILDTNGEVIWSQSEKIGMTFMSHRKDGKLKEIIAALESAVLIAKNELGLIE
ncbi:hypothetical protein GGR41_000549 [Paenalcaligenes hominis]|uniref:Uncharacterized protein n=1 Tax=Paenalcaligenes hominis TaxID=643674 RepID=A0ABX0WMF3_9BURK|nr:hypothetical protein [Paenalcaligenes hominis]NJB64328.1 hypothetical protein [Paenalcaligenes hominis]GGE68513.1 hypothetical protein GCM10007278_15730 [Paenalcaligenes hominis]